MLLNEINLKEGCIMTRNQKLIFGMLGLIGTLIGLKLSRKILSKKGNRRKHLEREYIRIIK